MAGFRTVFGIDLRSLALFRVCLGLVLIADLINRATNLTAHYTDGGILRRADAIAFLSDWRLSIHLWNGTALFEAVLFVIAGLFALALLAGYKTRLVTIVSWFLLLSLQNRNPIILQGGDNLLLLLLFWGMFLPLGARFSVDSSVNRLDRHIPNEYFSLTTMALLIQCMSVYFFSAFLKSGVTWMPDATATYFALHLDSLATPLAHWFRQFGGLLKVLTYFVWYLELLGPIFMFSPIFHVPVRLALMFLFIAMHIGFHVTLEIGLFPFISITTILAFTPTAVWDSIGKRLKTAKRSGVRLYYDQSCTFCKKTCLLLRTFLLLPETPILPAQSVQAIHAVMEEHNSWVVVDHDEIRYVRWQAIALVFRRSALFWPLGRLFSLNSLRGPGDRIYEFVAQNRGFFGKLTTKLLPYRSSDFKQGAAATACVGVAMALVFSINVTSLPQTSLSLPKALTPVRNALRFDQIWNMFAPNPARRDGWLVIRGELVDGTVVDVYNQVPGEPSFTKPDYVSKWFTDYRWRKYFSRFSSSKSRQLLNYGRYLCYSWNQGKPQSKKLSTHQIYFNREITLPNYRGNEFERINIWNHSCFKKD